MQARQRRRAARAARRRRRAGRRRRASTPSRSRRSSPRSADGRSPAGPDSLPTSSAVLVVLDGWGLAPDGPGNAVSLADTPVFDELWAGYPHTQLTACGRAVGPAGRADGQLRGRAPQPRRRRGRDAGPDAHRRGGRGRRAGVQRGAARGVRRRRARAPDRARLRRRRALRLEPPGGADPPGRRARRARPRPARVHRRARHARRPRARATWRPSRSGWPTPGPGASARSSAATTRWTATSAGTGSSCAYDLLVHGRAEHAGAVRRGGARDAYERDETDEFITPCWSATRRGSAPATRWSRSTSAPTGCARSRCALADPDVQGDRPRRRRADRALRDDDRVRGGLDLPGRVPARAPADDAHAGASPSTAGASCTSPRPRSTRTSRTSSTAARRNRAEGERRELVASPRDVPTYDHKPQMSAPEAADAFVKRVARTSRRVRDHQLRQRRHGRPHRRDRGRGRRRSRPSTSASARWSRRSTSPAARA